MPADRPREEGGFLLQLLQVVLAEVEMRGGGRVEGEDVGCGFEFRDGDEADLGGEMVSDGDFVGEDGWEGGTSREVLVAARMDCVTWERFAMSWAARWGFICISGSAIVWMGELGFGDVFGGRDWEGRVLTSFYFMPGQSVDESVLCSPQFDSTPMLCGTRNVYSGATLRVLGIYKM